jgi:carbonic anhydrase
MKRDELTDRIELIAKRVRADFDRLIHELNIADADARWTAREIIGKRVGDALVMRAPIVLADDDETLMRSLRPHTTDDPA